MSTPDNTLSIWNNEKQLAEIKAIYGAKLSDLEFKTLVGIGKATNLNPFLRELWAVKYGSEAAQIFIGRDGYRKASQANPEYDYHTVDAVYSNDTFEIKDGVPTHSYNLKDRGTLVGAYCNVRKHRASKPTFIYVELKEYNTGKSVWATKPATMIKKVAEAQGLRMAFQDIFAGTYDESETWDARQSPPAIPGVIDVSANQMPPSDGQPADSGQTDGNQETTTPPPEPASVSGEQLKTLGALIEAIGTPLDEVNAWVQSRFGCAIENLKESQAATLINVLGLKLKKKAEDENVEKLAAEFGGEVVK